MKALDLETQATICQLYSDGKNGPQISKLLKRNIKTIYKILGKYDLTKSASESKRVFQFNEHYFDDITTPRQAYWLGFISGDGGIAGNYLNIRLSERDKIILEQFNKDLQSNYNIHTYGKFVNLTVCSAHLVKSLRQHNIIPNKTKSFNLSNNIPDHLLGSYILGLNDADGCFSIDKKRGLRFCLIGTKGCVKEVQNILIEKCNVNKNKLQKHHSTSYIKYLVYSGDRQLRRIVDFLYNDNDFCLPRKFAIVKKYFDL